MDFIWVHSNNVRASKWENHRWKFQLIHLCLDMTCSLVSRDSVGPASENLCRNYYIYEQKNVVECDFFCLLVWSEFSLAHSRIHSGCWNDKIENVRWAAHMFGIYENRMSDFERRTITFHRLHDHISSDAHFSRQWIYNFHLKSAQLVDLFFVRCMCVCACACVHRQSVCLWYAVWHQNGWGKQSQAPSMQLNSANKLYRCQRKFTPRTRASSFIRCTPCLRHIVRGK